MIAHRCPAHARERERERERERRETRKRENSRVRRGRRMEMEYGRKEVERAQVSEKAEEVYVLFHPRKNKSVFTSFLQIYLIV